jgi:hypothetical protein
MGAREKLNRSYFNGSLMLAGFLGLLMQSWLVFFLALFILLCTNVYLNEIRPRKSGRGSQIRKSAVPDDRKGEEK